MKKQEFIEYTKEVWQPYYEDDLTELDATEINSNMNNFINLLSEWDREEKQKQSCKISYITQPKGDKK